jgi:hypothetical protein
MSHETTVKRSEEFRGGPMGAPLYESPGEGSC